MGFPSLFARLKKIKLWEKIRRRKKTVVWLTIFIALGFAWRRWSPTNRWRRLPQMNLNALIVDYTVPFDTFKEHLGIIWLLNHKKVTPPDEDAQWDPRMDYIGYYPDDRHHPTRLYQYDTQAVDLIYLADTYGVYRDDLKFIDEQKAHMDYNPLVYGGTAPKDVQTLAAHLKRGGWVIAEFNSMCDPTPNGARSSMEGLFGLQWSGWVARVFQDPQNREDVPRWFYREFEKQYPGRPLPTDPIFLLVDRQGQMKVVSDKDLDRVTPHVFMTEKGRTRYPDVPAEAPYYYWFSLDSAAPTSQVYASIHLPNHDELPKILEEIKLPRKTPFMVESLEPKGAGRAIYLAGDLSDVDFDPGPFDSAGRVNRQCKFAAKLAGVTSAPVFWCFYAPVMLQLFEELNHAHRQ